MAISVQCGNLITLDYSLIPQTVILSATSLEGISFQWQLLSVPFGSSALSETRGDFVNGIAMVQNPQFITDFAVAGAYVFQCTSTNGVEISDPSVDQEHAQQVVCIRTQIAKLSYPADSQFDWQDLVRQTWIALENYSASTMPTTLAALNTQLSGATLDDHSAARTPWAHGLGGALHSSSTSTQFSTLIDDATLDLTTASRPPMGSAAGDLSGSYPSPTVTGLSGVGLTLSGDKTNKYITWSGGLWRPYTVSYSGLSNLKDWGYPRVVTSGNAPAILVTSGIQYKVGLNFPPYVKQVWPTFSRDANKPALIYGVAPSGHYSPITPSGSMLLRLNDGKMYTSASPVTCDFAKRGLGGVEDSAGVVNTGLWHIYAVNSGVGTTFNLIATTADPRYGGPTSVPNYKYAWTVRVGYVGPTQIDYFQHHSSWNYYENQDSGIYGMYSETLSSLVQTGVWYAVNGQRMRRTNTQLGNLADVVPSGLSDQVMLTVNGYGWDNTDVHYAAFVVAGGNYTSYPRSTGYQYPAFGMYSYSGYSGSAWSAVPGEATLYSREVDDDNSACIDLELVDDMFSFKWINSRPVLFTGYMAVTLKGYKNLYYGLD